MKRRRLLDTPDWTPENTAARLRHVLQQPGAHDDRIGHHRTYHGNTDPEKTGLAVVSQTETIDDLPTQARAKLARVLRLSRRMVAERKRAQSC